MTARRWVVASLTGLAGASLLLGACSSSPSDVTAGTTAVPATAAPRGSAPGTTPDTAKPTAAGTTPGSAPGTTAGDGIPKTSTTTTGGTSTTLAGSSTTSTTSGGPTTTGVTTPGDAAFCQAVEQMGNEMSTLNPTDPAVFTKFKEFFAKLATLAPPAIKADIDTLNAAVQNATSIDAFETLDQDPKFKAANDHIEEWGKAHCPNGF